jgi:hypothetical protein
MESKTANDIARETMALMALDEVYDVEAGSESVSSRFDSADTTDAINMAVNVYCQITEQTRTSVVHSLPSDGIVPIKFDNLRLKDVFIDTEAVVPDPEDPEDPEDPGEDPQTISVSIIEPLDGAVYYTGGFESPITGVGSVVMGHEPYNLVYEWQMNNPFGTDPAYSSEVSWSTLPHILGVGIYTFGFKATDTISGLSGTAEVTITVTEYIIPY